MNWHSAGTPPIGFVARRRETTEEQIEHEVVAAISAIPGWDYEKVIRRPLTGGLMNSNWLLTYEHVTYFLKMFGKGSESFVDRRLSNEAAVKANALGISPRVELFDPEALIELFEFLDLYRPSTAADFMIERYYGEVRQELVSRVWVARAVSDMKWVLGRYSSGSCRAGISTTRNMGSGNMQGRGRCSTIRAGMTGCGRSEGVRSKKFPVKADTEAPGLKLERFFVLS
jgi:hypothetical protein